VLNIQRKNIISGGKVNNEAKHDPLFEAVKNFVIETRTPSIAFTQRTFLIGYNRTVKLLEALEGDVITPRNERGLRKMMTGKSNEYL
jgi:S-DNA-T family DNA segregation ATPase FtsK/SpoIIIE